ncbi:MAG: NlpC/P60 family protein [Cyclobacteriaceae bacterium]
MSNWHLMEKRKSVSQKRDADFVKLISLKYLNAPEIAGGKNPFGISPQGLVQMVFKIAGWPLPGDIQLQSNFGKKVKDLLQKTKLGDLAFFKDKKGSVDHVGIVLDENKIIHASGHVRVDYLNEEGILNSETKIYSHTLSHIRRVIGS